LLVAFGQKFAQQVRSSRTYAGKFIRTESQGARVT